ncbi:MAG TPA: CaiB/BaiF CoA-transferase family protein [Candidatus Cloacimonadota bacterium]|nr:CaiB/BaiF CoA-transferase family protein [Candidatus Cloacimonadota bacterium]HPS39509.1 CaiB/BaiF CoA-transferase family protein [Candidatus Cloacimonadota bacterium]
MSLPLAGIRVLDLTRVLAGPFCTMILSDLGAEVIKVEIPGTGDDSRAFGPFLNNRSLYFLSINRGKQSVSLNLKAERGKEILRDLVRHCDILVENYRPGVMDKLGLGYENLSQVNPRLIYAASTGFGHTGPDSQKPAYDILAQARSGIMSITGYESYAPTRVGMSLGDITASLFTAIGINAALYQRESTGKGQKIDVSMLDCQVAILENALSRYQAEGVSPKPLGNRHPTISPFQAYHAKDGYFVLAAGNDNLFRNLCNTLEVPDLADDPRFLSNRLRTENIDQLNLILDPLFPAKTVQEWLAIIDGNGIPCAPINDIEHVLCDKQVLSRNMIVEVEDELAGPVKIAGNPIKMTNVPESSTRGKVPGIGEHNQLIYGGMLGISAEDLKELEAQGVI